MKDKCTVQQEMELYEGFHILTYKYGNIFLDWYHSNSDYICNIFPSIENPENEMEKDINIIYEKIKNPRHYDYTQICEFEKKVSERLAHIISCSAVIDDEYKKMTLFFNRYSNYRHYYMIKLEL